MSCLWAVFLFAFSLRTTCRTGWWTVSEEGGKQKRDGGGVMWRPEFHGRRRFSWVLMMSLSFYSGYRNPPPPSCTFSKEWARNLANLMVTKSWIGSQDLDVNFKLFSPQMSNEICCNLWRGKRKIYWCIQSHISELPVLINNWNFTKDHVRLSNGKDTHTQASIITWCKYDAVARVCMLPNASDIHVLWKTYFCIYRGWINLTKKK